VPKGIVTTILRISLAVTLACLLLMMVLLFGIGYPSSGGGLGSPNYSRDFGLPLTFAYDHAVRVGGADYTSRFVLVPVNLFVDLIVWSAPWYLFLGVFGLARDHGQRVKPSPQHPADRTAGNVP
jgi:hypothetical protein